MTSVFLQFEALREVRDNTGQLMGPNYREVQDLNGRKVEINEVDDERNVYEVMQ